jgi:hypothetical protein
LSETGYFKIVGERPLPGAAERMVIDGKALLGIEHPSPTTITLIPTAAS